MQDFQSLLFMKQRLQVKANNSRQRISDVSVERSFQVKREQLFELTKQQIRSEFEETFTFPHAVQISTDQEIKLKQLLDSLITLNNKKRKYTDESLQREAKVTHQSSQTKVRISQSAAPKRFNSTSRQLKTQSSFRSSENSSSQIKFLYSGENNHSQLIYMSQYWNKSHRVQDSDQMKRFQFRQSYYVPVSNHNEDAMNIKLSDLKSSIMKHKTILNESYTTTKALEFQTQNIKDQISKIKQKIKQMDNDYVYASDKKDQFSLKQLEIQGQEQKVKNSRLHFEKETSNIKEKAHDIKDNKEIMIHNLQVQIKVPTDYYAMDKIQYTSILPKQLEQEKKIQQLNDQEIQFNNDLDRMNQAGQYIYVLLKIKHLFLGHIITIDWENINIKLKRNFVRTPKNLLVLWISRVMISIKQQMFTQILKDNNESQIEQNTSQMMSYTKILYVENPEGPQNLVSQLIRVYETMSLRLNIKIVDVEALNNQKNSKREKLRLLSYQTYEKPIQSRKTQLDLGEFDYIVNQNSFRSNELNTLSLVRSLKVLINNNDKVFVRIFWSLYEFLIKLMQMVDITHTKTVRFFKQKPTSIMFIDVSKEMEFIFTIKESIVDNSHKNFDQNIQGNKKNKNTFHIKKQINEILELNQEELSEIMISFSEHIQRNNLVDIFCTNDDYNHFFSCVSAEFQKMPLQDIQNLKQLMSSYFEILQHDAFNNISILINQMLDQIVSILNKFKNISPPNDQRRTQLLIDSWNYTKIQEAQHLVGKRLTTYFIDQDSNIEVGKQKKQPLMSNQNAIVHLANEMQLEQIRQLKSSIIIEKRKKEAFKVQERFRKQQEKDKNLDFLSREILYLDKTQKQIKCKTEAAEDTIYEDKGLVEHILNLQAIQNNTAIHQRLWSQEVLFTKTQTIQKSMSRQKNLLNQMVKDVNVKKHTDDQQYKLKRYLVDFKVNILSQQHEQKVSRLKEIERRKSFILFTSRTAYEQSRT